MRITRRSLFGLAAGGVAGAVLPKLAAPEVPAPPAVPPAPGEISAIANVVWGESIGIVINAPSSIDHFYEGRVLVLGGQVATIVRYDGSTKAATLSNGATHRLRPGMVLV